MGAFFHHLFRALGGYVQKWTKDYISSECKILHDFGDGQGAVPSAPVDKAAVSDNILSSRVTIAGYHYISDTNAVSDNIVTSRISIAGYHSLENSNAVSDTIINANVSSSGHHSTNNSSVTDTIVDLEVIYV